VTTNNSEGDWARLALTDKSASLIVGEGTGPDALAVRLAQQTIVERCADAQRAADLLRTAHYQSTVFDWPLSVARPTSSELFRVARDSAPWMPVFAMTASDGVVERVHALEAGVDDCISYDTEVTEVLARMRAAARRLQLSSLTPTSSELSRGVTDLARAFGLSKREQEVLSLVVGGTHLKEIGAKIGCTYATVRTHVRRLCHKLGCSGTREAIIRFFEFRTSAELVYPKWRLLEQTHDH